MKTYMSKLPLAIMISKTFTISGHWYKRVISCNSKRSLPWCDITNMLLNNCMILICSQPNLKLNLIKLMICQSFYLFFFKFCQKIRFLPKQIFSGTGRFGGKIAYLITRCRRLSRLWRTDSGSHLYSKEQDYVIACDGLKKINCWPTTTQIT